MTNEELAVVNKVLDTLSSSANSIVASYTTYMIASAVTFIVLGIVLLVAARMFFTSGRKYPGDMALLNVMSGVAAVVGALFLTCNVPDLFAPQAVAVHQLIKDIRGSK